MNLDLDSDDSGSGFSSFSVSFSFSSVVEFDFKFKLVLLEPNPNLDLGFVSAVSSVVESGFVIVELDALSIGLPGFLVKNLFESNFGVEFVFLSN